MYVCVLLLKLITNNLLYSSSQITKQCPVNIFCLTFSPQNQFYKLNVSISSCYFSHFFPNLLDVLLLEGWFYVKRKLCNSIMTVKLDLLGE